MPVRLEPFVNGSIYHVFNKTLDKRKLFRSEKYCQLFPEILKYYRSTKAKVSFSKLKFLDKRWLQQINNEVSYRKYFKVEILVHCLMPNHFHLLLKQKVNGGIQKFMADAVNSLTRYCNLQMNRQGPIFLPKFKSERILTDEQLLHVSRYIHLNPYTRGLVKTFDQLENYSWSSFPLYIREVGESLSDPSMILAFYQGEKERYRGFVLANAEYQKTLEYAKHTQKW